jgi:DNA-binding GntR family transcriptional regulator
LIFLSDIRSQARRIGTVTSYIPGRVAKSLQEHSALVEALQRRDPGQAQRIMADHMMSLCADLMRDFEEGGVSVTFLASTGSITDVVESTFHG